MQILGTVLTDIGIALVVFVVMTGIVLIVDEWRWRKTLRHLKQVHYPASRPHGPRYIVNHSMNAPNPDNIRQFPPVNRGSVV